MCSSMTGYDHRKMKSTTPIPCTESSRLSRSCVRSVPLSQVVSLFRVGQDNQFAYLLRLRESGIRTGSAHSRHVRTPI